MFHFGICLIRGNRVLFVVQRPVLKMVFDSAFLLGNRVKLFLITKFAKDTKGSGYFLIVNFVLFGRWSVTNGEINHY